MSDVVLVMVLGVVSFCLEFGVLGRGFWLGCLVSGCGFCCC